MNEEMFNEVPSDVGPIIIRYPNRDFKGEHRGLMYITDSLIPEEFRNSNQAVEIVDAGTDEVIAKYLAAKYINQQNTDGDDKVWFTYFNGMTEAEYQAEKVRSDIDFIAMMTNVDLDEN